VGLAGMTGGKLVLVNCFCISLWLLNFSSLTLHVFFSARWHEVIKSARVFFDESFNIINKSTMRVLLRKRIVQTWSFFFYEIFSFVISCIPRVLRDASLNPLLRPSLSKVIIILIINITVLLCVVRYFCVCKN